ncbi:glycosyltransferase [Nonomuraea jiangxiensis]|uniref:Glycosyltransferase, MGT family n=1 Tax=Nonomuraea jiangxiensis TaxID=633440 RepID=A0A1G8RYZ3_9ACTN|nr:glycosyltransferase [Nonomuraea jiangxiensis]SDJ21630.1 glycosyltransferase, MGT family [Nonomuraea jiangxiensis]
MARMLMATTPGEGHVNPLVSVARVLVERGHEVQWYAGAAFEGKVTGAGARHRRFRAAYDFSGLTRAEAFPHHAGVTGLSGMTLGLKEIFLDPAPDQMADLLEILDGFPADVVVTDETCFGAGLAAERAGLPLVWVATSVYILSSRDAAPMGLGLPPAGRPWNRVRNRLLAWTADSMLMRGIRRHADVVRARAGLPRLAGRVLENIVKEPDLYLMGTVPSFEYPRSDLRPQTRFVGALAGRASAPFTPPPWWDELSDGRPVVHVTQGTIADDADRLLGPALAALADEPVHVVATTGRPAAPGAAGSGASVSAAGSGVDGRLPANAWLEPYIPHDELLPEVQVMVTNGGYGGVNAALSHGVPLVVAGATEEKHEVGARVAWSGAGLHLTGRLSEERLREAVRRVLEDGAYADRAASLKEEFRRYDGPELAAAAIEELLAARSAGRTAIS